MESKKQDYDICCLSTLPIIYPADWTREHYAPKSRIPAKLAQNPYNIRPAIKIFNNIKGNLFPCEWQEKRYYMTYFALEKYHLTKREKFQLKQGLKLFENPPPQLSACPCFDCICRFAPQYCPARFRLDMGR